MGPGELQRGKEFLDAKLTLVAAQADVVIDALSNLGQEILPGVSLSARGYTAFEIHCNHAAADWLLGASCDEVVVK